jgi:hypothetical protein
LWTALVARDGAKCTSWIPELGLVRHEDPGRVVRELVLVERPR